jgi:hypothetical protein
MRVRGFGTGFPQGLGSAGEICLPHSYFIFAKSGASVAEIRKEFAIT